MTIGPNARSNTSRFPSGDHAGALSPRQVAPRCRRSEDGSGQAVGAHSEERVGLLPPKRRSKTMRSPSAEKSALTAVPPKVSWCGFAPGRATVKICVLSSSWGSMKRWNAIGPGVPGGVACAEEAEPAPRRPPPRRGHETKAQDPNRASHWVPPAREWPESCLPRPIARCVPQWGDVAFNDPTLSASLLQRLLHALQSVNSVADCPLLTARGILGGRCRDTAAAGRTRMRSNHFRVEDDLDRRIQEEAETGPLHRQLRAGRDGRPNNPFGGAARRSVG